MLVHDATAVEVTAALREVGVRPLLLKGSSTVAWLYGPRSERSSTDVDLLVEPARARDAAGVLRGLGFQPFDAPREERHANAWVREAPPAAVDLHVALLGAGVPPERAWSVLSSRTELLELGGGQVEMLDPGARALVVALHAAWHGSEDEQALADLARALDVLPAGLWDEAAALARELDAEPALAAGLCLTPAGRAAAARLALPERTTPEVALRAGRQPDAALTLANVIAAPGLRAKASLAARRAVLPPGAMRVRYPLARRGPLGLAAAYGQRALWLAASLPAAARAVARAHRKARR
jgi:hypothetical protein